MSLRRRHSPVPKHAFFEKLFQLLPLVAGALMRFPQAATRDRFAARRQRNGKISTVNVVALM